MRSTRVSSERKNVGQVAVEPPPSHLRTLGRALLRVGLAVFFLLVGYSKFTAIQKASGCRFSSESAWGRGSAM
jgi:hypothetical protein